MRRSRDWLTTAYAIIAASAILLFLLLLVERHGRSLELIAFICLVVALIVLGPVERRR